MIEVENNATCMDLWKIITANGYRAQKEKAIEEICELGTELARDIQGEGVRERITEEMADVYVVMAQMLLIYGNQSEVREVAWLEIRNLDGVIMVVPVEITGEMYLQGVKGTWRAEEIAPRRGDGWCTRFWDGRPTEEQRKATPWNIQNWDDKKARKNNEENKNRLV